MILKEEDGFSSPLAMTVIFSLCLLCSALGMYVFSCQKKINSFKSRNESYREAEALLKEFEKELQIMADEDCDCSFSYKISELKSRYSDYEIIMNDISTGINEQLLSKEILEDKNIKQLLEVSGEKIKTEYGWINKDLAEEVFVRNVIADFNGKQNCLLFNKIPLYNLYFMDEGFIRSILQLCKISNSEEKSRNLFEAICTKKLCNEDLYEIIGVNKDHKVFEFLGLKTVFWNVKLSIDNTIIDAVFAAIPSKKDLRTLEKYELIEKKIIYKGGNS